MVIDIFGEINSLGKASILLAMIENEKTQNEISRLCRKRGMLTCVGKVGSHAHQNQETSLQKVLDKKNDLN